MRLKAKFRGTCVACGESISRGDEIEWSKSEGARHAECDDYGADPVGAFHSFAGYSTDTASMRQTVTAWARLAAASIIPAAATKLGFRNLTND